MQRPNVKIIFSVQMMLISALIATGSSANIPVVEKSISVSTSVTIPTIFVPSSMQVENMVFVPGSDEKNNIFKMPVDVKSLSTLDLRTDSNISVDELRSMLKGTRLEPYSVDFVNAEKTYHVNAIFLVSVSALESDWGRSSLARNRNNIFSWAKNGRYTYFSSVLNCINTAADNLSHRYLTAGGSYFKGTTVRDVNYYYCVKDDGHTPNHNWSAQVLRIMSGLLNSERS